MDVERFMSELKSALKSSEKDYNFGSLSEGSLSGQLRG